MSSFSLQSTISDPDSFKINVLEPKESIEHKYIQRELSAISKLETHAFNVYDFYEYVSEIPDKSFNGIFKKYIAKTFKEIDTKFLSLNLNLNFDQEINKKAHLRMIKEIFLFLMNHLPYTYLRGYLSKINCNTLPELVEHIENDILLKSNIIQEIENDIVVIENFDKIIMSLKDGIPNKKSKDKYEVTQKLLQRNLDARIIACEFFIKSITETSNTKFLDMVLTYIENDVDNIHPF